MPPPRRCRRGVSLLGLAVLLLAGCGGSGAGVAPTFTGPASPLPIGTLGVPYASTFTASGDTPTWAVTAGALAPGLALDPVTGGLTGTPTLRGTFSFTVRATNAAGTDARDFTHAVFGPVVVSEAEGNDTPATASPATLGTPAQGSLVAPGDVDVWSVSLTAGQDLELELFSTRRDPGVWDAADNRMVATLRAPDGVTSLVTTEPSLPTGIALDQDVARVRVTSTGTHFLELRAFAPAVAGGRYAFVVRPVTLSNPQTAVEPHDTPATASPLAPGTVFSTRAAGDEDWYAVTVAEPTIVRFETFAHRNGVHGSATGRFDPIVDLADATGTTFLKSRDDGIFFDTVFAYRIGTPGTYAVRVRSFGGGEHDGSYLLRYDAQPVGPGTEAEPNSMAPSQSNPIADGEVLSGAVSAGDDDVFSFPGDAGDEVHVQLLALASDVQGATATVEPQTELLGADGISVLPSSAPGPSQRIRRTILKTAGTCFVRVSTTSAVPTPYTLRLSIVERSAFEAEPNDAPAETTPVPNEGRISGDVDAFGDVDVYAFPAVTGELVVLSLLASVADASNADLDGWGSTIVPRLVVTDSASTVLLAADDLAPHRKARGTLSGMHRVELAFVAPFTGTFFVHVSDVGFTPTPHYTLIKR